MLATETTDAPLAPGQDQSVVRELRLFGVQSLLLHEALEEANAARDALDHDLAVCKEQFQGLFETGGVGILISDAGGRVRSGNHVALRMLGYPISDLREFALQDLIWEDDRVHVQSLIDQELAQDGSATVLARLRRCDGSAVWVQVSFSLLMYGTPGLVAVFQDVSKQRKLEEERLQRDAWQRAILETAPDGIVAIDTQGVIRSCNSAAERLFGWRAQDTIGRDVTLLIPALYRSRFSAVISAYLDSGARHVGGRELELSAQHADGSTFPILLTVREFELGGERFFCAFIRDTTQKASLENQLFRAQKLEAVGTLAAGVAHDFNNLLMGIAGCATIVSDHLDPSSSAHTYIAEIQRAILDGAAVTKQLLAFGQVRDSEPIIVELDPVIKKSVRMLRHVIPEDIDLVLELDAPGSHVRCAPGRIEQILMNLVVNARDAMRTGGSLRIETRISRVPPPMDTPSQGHGDETWVVLSVLDSGGGISAENKARIFDPFFTTKATGEGTGLGLAMVYGALKDAHGYIDVHSEVGVGTRFDLYFRDLGAIARVEATDSISGSAAHAPSGRTVLVVEDNAMVRMSMRYFLERAGYRVLEAASGKEAIQCCQDFPGPVDLVVTDVILPGANGAIVAQEVTALKPGIQILFVSANDQAWLESEQRLPIGVSFLKKPFTEDELRAAVQNLGTRAEPTTT